MSEGDYRVTCFCAAWCDVCSDYRDGFDALAPRFPQARFGWVDIEENPPEFEIENFPTLEVAKGSRVLFRGPQPPAHALLERLLRELLVSS